MVEIVKYSATGRRKSSVARVTLTPGDGKNSINDRNFDEYFVRESDRINILQPVRLANVQNKFDISVSVAGGGLSGQAGAIRLGISRALIIFDAETRGVLKKADCLRRDPRMKERKKPGQKGARKKFQWVKR